MRTKAEAIALVNDICGGGSNVVARSFQGKTTDTSEAKFDFAAPKGIGPLFARVVAGFQVMVGQSFFPRVSVEHPSQNAVILIIPYTDEGT
jgi:hypothetical protein